MSIACPGVWQSLLDPLQLLMCERGGALWSCVVVHSPARGHLCGGGVLWLWLVLVLQQQQHLLLVLQDFFETCAMLITVVILGKYMECAAKGKTSEAIQVGGGGGGRHHMWVWSDVGLWICRGGVCLYRASAPHPTHSPAAAALMP